MYQPTHLVETLLREEKLDKKFISLLLACDEQRAFACQTPTMARETVTAINMRIRTGKLGLTDLLKLSAFLKQSSDEILVENCVFWISECLKVTGSRRNEEKAFDIIKLCLEKSRDIKKLTNLISKKVVPRLLDQLLKSQKPTYSAIQCLQILFQFYSEPCKAQWESLQKYLLNFMDEEDQNLVKYTSRCICYLPLITENSNNQGSAWSKLLTELCVAANSVLHQLFRNVPEIVITSSLGEIAEGIQVKPIESSDSILLAQRLAQRFINILIFIEGMLEESCDYIKEIRIDLVITLAHRGLSVNYDMLKNSSTMWHVALISVLADIQTQLLNLLKSLVSCCKGGLLKFGPLFCNIIIKTLKVNSSPLCPGMKQYYSKTRKAVYNFLENWILRAKAASCVELFDEELISLLFHDLCQRKYSTSNWVQELCNQYRCDHGHWQEIHIKPISSTCEAALRALCALVLTSGSRLTLSVHKKLQEFVASRLVEVQQSCSPEDIPAPYNVPECRLHLYQLLLVLTLHPHPQWPPPTNYAFSLFPRGQQDSSPEVIKLCTTSMMSIHKMVHLPSVESSLTLFPFKTSVLNEKESEKQGISELLTKISKSSKVCKRSQNAFSPTSVKALKRSFPGCNSDTFPKRKRFTEGSIESLVNTKALQSTDKDWIVKRISKNQSKKTDPERNRKEICRAVDLQKTIKKRKHYRISDKLRRDLLKCHSLAYGEQDISEEITLVDLVSDSEITDSDKILHSNESCEELITIDDFESSGSQNYISIEEKMEAFTKDMEEEQLSPNDPREIGEGIKGTERTRDKVTKNIYDIENDYNVGANEEINDAEKIVKEAKSVIGKECRPSVTTDPENHCQVQSGIGSLEVTNPINTIEDCGTKINTGISNSDNPSHVLSHGMSQIKTVEEAKLPTEISSSAEQSPSNEVLTVNRLDIDSFVVDNSQKLTSSRPQMLLQGADIKEMTSSPISSISLNAFKETNLLEKEHTYVVKSHSDLIELTNLTVQKENTKIKDDDNTIDMRASKDVTEDKICLSGASKEAILPLAVKKRKNIETIGELCTRNNETAASLDDSKQELVSYEEKSLPTGEETNVIQIVDESSTRKQNAPAINNEKATSLDGSKYEPVAHEEMSLLTVEESNVMKTIDESAIRKQDAPATNNKKAASLGELKQDLVSHEISLPTVKEGNGIKIDELSRKKQNAPAIDNENERNVIKIGDEPSTRKQNAPAINNENAISFDESKQEPVSLEEMSLLTLEESNVMKTIDESATRKQDAPATNNKNATSLDLETAKQDAVSFEKMSLLIEEKKNVIKANDESSTKKKDVQAMDNENAASLDDSQQEPIPYSESTRKDIEVHYVEVNEVCLLEESSEVRNKQLKKSSKGVEPNDIADSRRKGSPVDVNEAEIVLLADSVEVIDLEAGNDRKNNLEAEIVGTTADAIITGKENTLPDSSCVVNQMSNDDQETVTSSVIQKDVLSESKGRTFLEEAFSGQQHIEEDSQMKGKEQNSFVSAEEDSLKTLVDKTSPKSA